jgi:hypothetical protein
MKLFLKKLFFFISPIFLLIILIEYYCGHDTTFVLKNNYIEKNKSTIEVLFLGSSHTQNAINPEFIKKKACNLAFAGQTLENDYSLLEKYISQMPKLRTVFFEVSPHTFYSEFDSSNWNGYIYSNLYDIDYKVDPYSLKKYFYLLSNFKFFSSLYFDYANPFSYKYTINKYGFITNDFNDRFLKLHYNSSEINKTFVMEHTFQNKDLVVMNSAVLEKAIVLCKEKGVKIVLITAPLYDTYVNGVPKSAKTEVLKTINTLKNKYQINYFDYSTDSTFKVSDFKNDNHLNSDGARKFSSKIDSLLTSSY